MADAAAADPLHDRFVRDVLANAANRAILARWDRLALADAWLVAGCLFQAAWNLQADRPAAEHVNDHDLFYFDPSSTSEEDERRVQAHVDAVLGDLGVVVEASNQARVHLWYEAYFGHPYPALADAKDGIDRFLVRSTCVGIRPCGAAFDVYAPNGLESIYDGTLEPNPRMDQPALFERKAASYRERWPSLRVMSRRRQALRPRRRRRRPR